MFIYIQLIMNKTPITLNKFENIDINETISNIIMRIDDKRENLDQIRIKKGLIMKMRRKDM